MQSVFKLPLALTVLHLADTGKLLPAQLKGEPIGITLDRTVRFLPQDRIRGAYSPSRIATRMPTSTLRFAI